MYGAGVLQNQVTVISPDFGSIWQESIIRTPIGVYGVDTYAKKIWRVTYNNSFETISDLYDNKIVKTIKDLYRLKMKRKEIINLRGFGEKKYSLMISEIDSHRDVLDSVFLGSIGIPHCSKEVFKKILNYSSLFRICLPLQLNIKNKE